MALDKESIKWCREGDPSLLVLTLPPDLVADGAPASCFACPIAMRDGGVLLGLPDSSVSPEAWSATECDEGSLTGLCKRFEVVFVPEGESGGIRRDGGVLLGLPDSSVSPEAWSATECDEGSLTGLCKRFEVVFVQEGESGGIRPAGFSAGIVAVDFSDEVLHILREYDAVADEGEDVAPFSSINPVAIPDHISLHRAAMEWVQSQSDQNRVHFYSAREEPDVVPPVLPAATKRAATNPKRITNATLVETINALADQVKLLSSRQDTLDQSVLNQASTARGAGDPVLGARTLPSLSAGLPVGGGPPCSLFSKAVTMVGPPPKVRAGNAVQVPPATMAPNQEEPLDPLAPREELSPIASALVQQGAAITALVSHLTAQSGDAMVDLSSPSSGLGIRGVQRRERLQGELAGRTGNFFLTMMQQVHKKLHPSKAIPKQIEEFSSLSMLTYLKEQGGYKGQRELGLIMWLLGHIVDLMAAQDYEGAKEHLSLMVVAVEQAATDGNWSLAYMLTLVEEPPLSLFQDRLAMVAPHGRPFSPLVPPQWAAAVLSYVKEMELLQSKKKETTASSSTPKASAPKQNPEGDAENPVSPKRKARFPRKPKASPEA